MERSGLRATEALAELCARIDVRARVLPMCDEPIHTCRQRHAAAGVPDSRRRPGCRPRRCFDTPLGRLPEPSPEVLQALAGADVVIIGPSNPAISIAPILSVLERALASCKAPVVAVSPIVAGKILKGPTAAFLAAAGQPLDAGGVVGYYQSLASGLLDGIVCDEQLQEGRLGGLPGLSIDTRMDERSDRARVAERSLAFARSLR